MDDLQRMIRATPELVDRVARAILRTWSEDPEADWADELIRERRRIEARAAIGDIRQWLSARMNDTPNTTDLYDVVAINIKTGARRPLATVKTERIAKVIIKMAVVRWGVEEEFYMAIPVGEREPDLADVTRKIVESEREGR